MTLNESCTAAEELLGYCGRMLDGNKMRYRSENPENLVVHNANVCTETGKVWFGDIDVTKNEENLKTLAERLGAKVFVLREHDARFSNEEKPLLEKAVASF